MAAPHLSVVEELMFTAVYILGTADTLDTVKFKTAEFNEFDLMKYLS